MVNKEIHRTALGVKLPVDFKPRQTCSAEIFYEFVDLRIYKYPLYRKKNAGILAETVNPFTFETKVAASWTLV